MNADWDEHNINHIAKHNVTPEEVEEALLALNRISAKSDQVHAEPRWIAIGETQSGRILFVVFTIRVNKVRVVTAYDATIKQKERYRMSSKLK